MTDNEITLALVGGVLGVLAVTTGVAQALKRRTDGGINPAVVHTFNLRVRAWWMMWTVLAAAMLFHPLATVALFGGLSFWALREFITLTPTRPGDHRVLFWVFFGFTPLQYILVAYDLYQLYSILIPVYGFLFIPCGSAFGGDYKRFLERAAKIQAALMICVYCLSYAPAILSLKLQTSSGGEFPQAQNSRLLFYFVLIVQIGDVMQFVWEKLAGRRRIAPAISGNKTWEGYLGGVASATLIGTALWWATPFSPMWAAGMSLLITVMGYAGGLTMSAIKRDRGVKDYGTLVEGHGGVLDRIDSICFAAPVFFHVTRYFFEISDKAPSP
jgi:phosphatidate cytidylyltransferase